MITSEEAIGATDKELACMNEEVLDLMDTAYHCNSLSDAKLWAEGKVLSKYGYM